MPKKGEKPRGVFNAQDFVEFIYEMTEKIAPPEKPGFLDNIILSGLPFSEVRPDGTLSYEFETDSLSIVNMLKTADCTTLASFALIPVRTVETAYLTSKSEYAKFKKELEIETEYKKNDINPAVLEELSKIYGKESESKAEKGLSTHAVFRKLNRIGYDSKFQSFLLGYLSQASGNPDLDESKVSDVLGDLVPNSFKRGQKLRRAGRDLGTAYHEYLTENLIQEGD